MEAVKRLKKTKKSCGPGEEGGPTFLPFGKTKKDAYHPVHAANLKKEGRAFVREGGVMDALVAEGGEPGVAGTTESEPARKPIGFS